MFLVLSQHSYTYRQKFGCTLHIVMTSLVLRKRQQGVYGLTFRSQYILLSPKFKLTDHYVSRLHYVTIELMVHAAINHFLCLFLCFPNTPYSLRNTGNRTIEALHGTFRGGTCSLPITSPNLSFREFLDKMNKMLQIHEEAHQLKQIKGHSIVASKKEKDICKKCP